MNFHYNAAKYRQFTFSLPRNYSASHLEDFCTHRFRKISSCQLFACCFFPFPQLSSSEIHIRSIWPAFLSSAFPSFSISWFLFLIYFQSFKNLYTELVPLSKVNLEQKNLGEVIFVCFSETKFYLAAVPGGPSKTQPTQPPPRFYCAFRRKQGWMLKKSEASNDLE